MKRLVVMILLAFFLAGCASDQGRPRGYRWDSDAAWECHKINSLGWSAGKPPCDF
jgi:PBP1b-binding outer membrane lipoprotein LpoB